jgi:hypothetical protein
VDTLNPTLADGLWAWRQGLDNAAMIVSTLIPQDTLSAARELARELAGADRAVVLTGVGASEPLSWFVPAGKELDSVQPDLVLLLIHKHFAASARLLLATASHVILITGDRPEDRAAAVRLMQMIVKESSPSHVEVVVVAEGRRAARDTGDDLVSMAAQRFGNRTRWRHLPARRLGDGTQTQEEGTMASTRSRSVPLSETEVRAREWEESFRRAERLLQQAQDTLRRQLERSAEPVRAAQEDAGNQPRAL